MIMLCLPSTYKYIEFIQIVGLWLVTVDAIDIIIYFILTASWIFPHFRFDRASPNRNEKRDDKKNKAHNSYT